jgi:hypothetical protein
MIIDGEQAKTPPGAHNEGLVSCTHRTDGQELTDTHKQQQASSQARAETRVARGASTHVSDPTASTENGPASEMKPSTPATIFRRPVSTNVQTSV